MKYAVVASLLAASVSALSISDIPPCALACAAQGAPKCLNLAQPDDPKNVDCLCKSDDGHAFQKAVTACVEKPGACEAADQCKLYKTVQAGCGSTPLVAQAPPGCAAGGAPSTGGSTSAAAPAGSTSAAGTGSAPAGTATGSTAPSGTGAAPPVYGTGSASTVATSAATGASSGSAAAPTGTAAPTYTPSGASANAIANGVAALFAGVLVVLAL